VAVPKSLIVADDGVSGTIMPDRVHNLFYHDCSPADASDSAARLRPQALAPLSTAIHLTTGRFGRVPRAYIECTEDRALVVDMQRDMISKSWLSCPFRKLCPDVMVVQSGEDRDGDNS